MGEFPFMAHTKHNLATKIRENEPKWSGSRGRNISPEARDFVTQCLYKLPGDRALASELVTHQWFKEASSSTPFKLDPNMINQLKKFQQYDKLKQMSLAALAHKVVSGQTKQLGDLRVRFEALDNDHSGTIELGEFKNLLSHSGN